MPRPLLPFSRTSFADARAKPASAGPANSRARDVVRWGAIGVVLLAVNTGCQSDHPPVTAAAGERRVQHDQCVRLPIPAFPVGANVIDHPDDEDNDPKNDGARGYGSDAARRTLDALTTLGLDGVVLPVSVRATDRSALNVRGGPLLTEAGTRRLGRMIDDAHDRGLFVVLVPHLHLDDGAWRGALAPGDGSPRDVDRFLAAYGQQAAAIARVGQRHCAEAMSFAVEFKSLTLRADARARFAPVIASLRNVFDGALTYSANWDEIETVPFWADLDGMAVNAFFPLDDQPPPEKWDEAASARIDARALAIHRHLAEQKRGRPLWFMELGFKSVNDTARKPWQWLSEVPDARYDEAAQAAGYAAHRAAWPAAGGVDAVFFWAVAADDNDVSHPYHFEDRRGFSFRNKRAERIVKQYVSEARKRRRP